MIDKKKLIDDMFGYKFCDYCDVKTECYNDEDYECEGIMPVIRLINSQPKINGWIPIYNNDDLPKESGCYYIAYKYKIFPERTIYGIHKFWKSSNKWSINEHCEILAWMELPTYGNIKDSEAVMMIGVYVR